MRWPFRTPGERSAKPLMVSCRPNGKPFMAKRQTFLTKHTETIEVAILFWTHGDKDNRSA